jgi:hypothetical protein
MSWTSDLIVGLAGLASTIGAVAIGTVILVTLAQLGVLACRRLGFCSQP